MTQTVGTGLAGTIHVNHRDTAGSGGVASPLAEDPNPANVAGAFNWYRITGLTPDGSRELAFDMGGVNTPLSGFQLIEDEPGDGIRRRPTRWSGR